MSAHIRILVVAAGLLAGLLIACGDAEEVLESPSSITQTGDPTASSSPAVETTTPSPVESIFDIFVDERTQLSFPYPKGNGIDEASVELPGKDGIPPVVSRQIVFKNEADLPTISISISPNPGGLDLETWIRTIPGWPSDPREIFVSGRPALLFDIDQAGAANPTAYFRLGEDVFGIRGNVAGGAGSSGVIDYDEFLKVLDGVTE